MEDFNQKIIDVLSTIHDPEIPVNIWDLGFIYNIDIKTNKDVDILMTLTAPNCPVAETLPVEVQNKVAEIPGIGMVNVKITFDPPWTMEKLSDVAKLELGLM
ncbi:iron-sulfur cluster assembly protein [Bacteroidales bacterium OttesenSCG-928-B11]|nr:iron-sulfur cluster assembly protein [Bacteroidales bacterium OttesenSCG-928-C03]MDL2312093.1 iron-sulfur cluster assembly protein [Bacteroidales bacterium OttesenSCG-928-B11]MDL2326063.1 iron-sulfur cluster assembly protein [Bacteroidales bacterium OttesenSCG-928-A14]